ncbi:DsrE family protein [Arthrobacter sp. H35-D1]|uniref:DsrE family protein n=1 Tax=Arthrobacter sp. H35-D1 TaxID=3046202 RepID=UPI0024B8E960|nr:DsrE family protein [Arthrobacter sp. H35-D1]MDJ0311661.1 DsrE family protein [Arthrobacter sp. H35-D1]
MTAGNEDANDTRNGLVFHGFGVTGEQVAGVFRSALNAAAALPAASIEIVIQGKAVTALAVDGGLSIPVFDAQQAGIAVFACENSMRAAALDRENLLPGVGTVPSAVLHLAQRQWENWAYIRL